MEKVVQKLKQINPSTWALLVIIAILVVMWGVERMNGQKAHRELKNHYESQFKEKDDIINGNNAYIDSITVSSKKKDSVIDSLGGTKSASRVRVIYVEKDSDEKVYIIRSAGRDSTRLLFTGYVRN